ncbi:putative DOPA-dioxygenase [Suhomyces tanzawaensis NRRL Y-17324]|uniref:Putative DOPA-dioxygenase n=1 Tax=Suhomyces tanzawaensis NRRL Y-17324 TaxID=984487 RepID=A0A1E4SHL9_9ASCO|nr:putative DOPA-dioxygenase [Suhomyces tanzawaensis NRRL Y-17324]ODV78986.1 putative DOPA-dioxygenase [Suhomyces tanzawaensis NRRL Y-17324]
MEYLTHLTDPRTATTSVHGLTYTYPVQYYDFHVYYYAHQAPSKKEAFDLLDKLLTDFAHEGNSGSVIVKRLPDDKVIGPHSTQFWEVDVLRPEVFVKLLSWFQLHHGNLSVLIHPQTGEDTADHTSRALWLGRQLPVFTHIFSDDGKIPEFGVKRGQKISPDQFDSHVSQPQGK